MSSIHAEELKANLLGGYSMSKRGDEVVDVQIQLPVYVVRGAARLDLADTLEVPSVHRAQRVIHRPVAAKKESSGSKR